MDISKLKKDLIASEGICLKPYVDQVGKITIGIGRNLEGNGISLEEATILLDNDIQRIQQELEVLEVFPSLSEVRQRVIFEMAFNLGIKRLLKFRKMWNAIYAEQWELAANEMLNSRWAKQVGKRAIRLARRMQINADEKPKNAFKAIAIHSQEILLS
jgi:lysozyme